MISYDPVVITDLEIPAVAEMFCKGTVFAYNIRWTLALHCLINSLNSVYHMYVHLMQSPVQVHVQSRSSQNQSENL